MDDIAKNSTNASNTNQTHTEDSTQPCFVSMTLMLLLATATFCASIRPASAEMQHTVYRCIGAKNAISYQDVPCAPHEHTSATRRFTVPKAVAQDRARKQDEQHRERSATRVIRIASARAEKPRPPSRCEAAKAKRESGLERLGLKRDFALMSSLDRAVWDACKGL